MDHPIHPAATPLPPTAFGCGRLRPTIASEDHLRRPTPPPSLPGAFAPLPPTFPDAAAPPPRPKNKTQAIWDGLGIGWGVGFVLGLLCCYCCYRRQQQNLEQGAGAGAGGGGAGAARGHLAVWAFVVEVFSAIVQFLAFIMPCLTTAGDGGGGGTGGVALQPVPLQPV